MHEFRDNIINGVGGDTGGRMMGFDEGDFEVGVPLMRNHIYAWGGLILFLTEGWQFYTMYFNGVMKL